jgi:hypothetical protein
VQTCEIPGCDEETHARGWCQKHYWRWKRHGDPLIETVIVGDHQRRFWSKVDKNGPVPKGRPDLGPCWVWGGGIVAGSNGGYGTFQVSKYKAKKAHRVAYEWEAGPIPEGMTLDHLCHNDDGSCPGGRACLHRRCVRPSHLEPVTAGVNSGRVKNRKEACVNGHRFDEQEYQRFSGPYRLCVVCRPLKHPFRKPGECVNGHKIEGENAVKNSDGITICRECSRAAGRRAYARRKARAAVGSVR